jgi:hypothetical protein
MNPVGFFGAAVGAQLAIAAVVGHYRPDLNKTAELGKLAPEAAWVLDLLSSQLPLVKAVIFASVVHWRLRKKGSTQAFRGSLGAVLFAEGWEAVGNALAAALTLVAGAVVGGVVSSILSVAALVMLALALAGVHRLTRWRFALGPMALGGLAVAIAASFATSALWGPKVLAALEGDGEGAAVVIGKDGVEVRKKK